MGIMKRLLMKEKLPVKRQNLAFKLPLLILLTAILAIVLISQLETSSGGVGFVKRAVIRRFNQIYYDSYVWGKTAYLGIEILQYPTDLWATQEIIAEIKPDFIIETGTHNGGSSLFFADILGKINESGKVISVDIEPNITKASSFPSFRDRVEVIVGDSVSGKVIDSIARRVQNGRIMVTLDSLHTKEHVLKEMVLYSCFVSLGSYLIVQDTAINGHPTLRSFGPGPMEAVEEFLRIRNDFVVDHGREKFLLTAYPSGFLKRVK